MYLDQLIDIHFYLRDAKAILSTSTAQEIALTNTDTGSTIEEVEAHLKVGLGKLRMMYQFANLLTKPCDLVGLEV